MSRPARRGLPDRVSMRATEHLVDALVTRDDPPVGRQVPISSVEPDPNQPRSSMGDIDDLVSSIRSKGVLEPILVRPNPAHGDSTAARPHLIISGERRFRAALEAGLLEIPVIELDIDATEALEIALIENLQRKDLTPFEEAEGYRALGEQYGYTHEQVAAAVGKSRTVVTEALSLLQMPRRVQDAALALDVTSRSALLEVMKARDEEEMIQLLERVATQHLSRDDLRRQTRGRSGGRRKPYTFTFKAPDKSFHMSLKFRRSTVERTDLISALEEILQQLRDAEAAG